MEKLPVSLTTPVPITVLPSRTVMVLPASPRPVRVLPLLRIVKLSGAPGAIVSTVIEVTGDAALRLPAASRAVVVKVWLPPVRALSGVQLQLPVSVACTVPTRAPLS
ncbi:hypothetical protein D3C76_1592480 [compost metagenome]